MRRLAAGVVMCALAGAGVAHAQTTARRTPRQPFELDLGVTFMGGSALGSLNGNETQPDGTPLALFSTTSRLDAGIGVSAAISHHIAGPLWAAVSGSWSRATFATTVTADFENAALTTATNPASQYTVEGTAIWQFKRHGHLAPFLRGGGGWLRQVSDDQSFLSDGSIVTIGGGVKYWWRDRPRGVPLGLRIEVDAVGRSGGLPLGARTLRVAPFVAASLMLHF